MANPSEIEMSLMCRLCLAKDRKQVTIPIFEDHGDIRQIFLKISSCLPIKITKEDQLPKNICDGCSDKLDLLYEFWNTSLNSEKTLLFWLAQAGLKDDDDPTIGAHQQIVKPVETLVKEEIGVAPNLDLPQDEASEPEEEPEAEEPPKKRARRTAAVKAQIQITPESEDDDDDEDNVMMDEPESVDADAIAKLEEDSEESDGEEKVPPYADVPGTSAQDQPGTSGLGKDGAEAPPLLTQFEIKKEPKSKKNNNVEDNNFKEEPREENDYYIDPSIYSSLNIQLGEELRALDWPGATAYQGILTLDQLPQKSKLKYEKAYCGFMNWLKESQFPAITEDALVTYFTEKSQVFKSSTLWSLFSMIKATMIVQDNIDMGEYKRLLALLKCKNKGYVANKSKVFTKEQLQQFLKEAPDKTYLMMKVALILGISGGLRRDELSQLGIDEIEDLGAALVVKIPDSKSSNLHRTFTVIPEQADELDCLDIYRKYLSLRPKNVRHRRFFVTYRGGKCTPQVVGVNTFGKIPKLVAKYLDLPQLERYNGHSFKKSSVSLTKTDRFF